MRNLIKKSVSLLLAFTMVFSCNGMTTLAETITTTSEPVASSSPSGMEVVEESDVKYEVGLVQSGHGSIQFSDTDSATKKLPPGSSVSLVITPANGWYLDYVIDSDTGDVVWQGDGNEAVVTTPDRAFYLEPVFARGTKQKSSSGKKSNGTSSGGIDTESGLSSESKSGTDGITVETPVENEDQNTEEKAPDVLAEDDGIVVETPVEEDTKKNRSAGDSVAKANNQYAVIGTANALPFYMGQGGFRSGPVSDIHGLVGPYGGRESGTNFECYLIRNHEKSNNVYYWYRNAGTMLVNDRVTRVSVQVFPWVTCVEATENTERKETDDDHYFWLRTAIEGANPAGMSVGGFGGTAQFNDRYYKRYHRIFDSSVVRENGDGTDVVNKLDDSHACLLHLAFKFYNADTGAQIPNASGMVWFNDLDSGLGWWQEGVLGERGNCRGFVTGMSAIEPQSGFMTGTLDHDGGSIDFAAAGIGFVADGDTFGMVYQSPRGSFASHISFVSTNLSYKFLPYETSDGRVIWPTKKTNNGVVQYDENLMYDELLPYAGGDRNNHSLILSRYVDTSTDDAAYLFGSVPLPGYEFEGWFANNNNVTTPYGGVPSMADNVELRGRYVPITGGLSVHKTVQNLNSSGLTTLQNMFSFRLTGTSLSGAPVDMTVSTDSNGNAEFTDVPISDPEGTGYTLTEIFNAGAENWEPRRITGIQITRDTVRQVSVENVYKTGSVKVVKDVQNDTNFGHQTKDGFTFVLTGTSNDGRSITRTSVATTSSGVVEFTEVPFGTYTVREEGRDVTTPVSGFETNNGVWNVTYQGGNQVVVNTAGQATQAQTKTVINRMPKGTIRVYKTVVDPTGKLIDLKKELQQIRFSAYSRSSKNAAKEDVLLDAKSIVESTITVDGTQATGYVEFEGVPIGEYTVREVNASDAAYQSYWTMSHEEQVAVVEENGRRDVRFTDTFKDGSLDLQKHVSGLEDLISGANPPAHPLAGFKFSVDSDPDYMYAGGAADDRIRPVHEVITTDNNGRCSLSNLPVGKYRIKEIDVPSWWTHTGLDANYEWDLYIVKGQSAHIDAYNNYDVANIYVHKDVKDPSGLHSSAEGFGYRLRGVSASGENVDVPVQYTDPNGDLVFKNVPVGENYTVTEVITPTSADAEGVPAYWDCVGGTSKSTYARKGDDTGKVNFTNVFKTGTVHVQKNIVDHSGLLSNQNKEGYTFELSGTTAAGDVYTKRQSTNVSGMATFLDVPVGSYTITEVSLPNSISADTPPDVWSLAEPVNIEVKGYGEQTFPAVNRVRLWYPEIHKEVTGNEAENGNLSGFKFRLRGFVSLGHEDHEIFVPALTEPPLETDGDGKILFTNGLPLGQWTIMEEDTPSYYKVPDHQTYTATKADENLTRAFTFTNVYKTGVIVVKKSVKDFKYPNNEVAPDLSGFRFRLTGTTASGKLYTPPDVTTEADGIVKFSNVPVGTYKVEEVGSNNRNFVGSWWVKAPTVENIEVLEDSSHTVPMENIYKRGHVQIKKIIDDPTGAHPSADGFVFKLTGTSDSGETVEEFATTTDNGTGVGIATFEYIPVGRNYTVTEVGTPDMNGESIGTAWSPHKLSVSGIKVEAAEDGSPVTTTTVGDQEIAFTNTYRTGNLTVQKEIIDQYHNTYGLDAMSKANFTFRITSVENENLYFDQDTDENGTARWENIPAGKYRLEEIATPSTINGGKGSSVASWWDVSVNPQIVDITYDDNTETQGETNAVVTNTYKLGRVVIKKSLIDHSGTFKNPDGSMKLEGFVFELKGSSDSGEEVHQWLSTDKNGDLVFQNIPFGRYTLTEVTAYGSSEPLMVQGPTTYWDVSPWTTPVVVDDTPDAEPITVTNTFKTGNVLVEKEIEYNTDNQNVRDSISKAGFRFRLHGKSLADMNGLLKDVDMVVSTDEDGKALFENVPMGHYTISEIGRDDDDLTLSEWWTASDDQEVDVTWDRDGEQEPNKVLFKNSLDVGSIKVTKKVTKPDKVKMSLAGFKFRLTGKTKSGIELTPVEKVTNEQGEVIFTGIPVGSNYKVEEIATPGSDSIDTNMWDAVQPVKEGIAVVKNEQTEVDTFTNVLKTGDLTIRNNVINHAYDGMTDNDSEEVPRSPEEFSYKIVAQNPDGTLNPSLTYEGKTNTDGVAVFEDIPVGRYVVTEVSTPDGNGTVGDWWVVEHNGTMTSGDNPVIEVPYNGNAEVKFTNTYKLGNLTVQKELDDAPDQLKTKSGFVFLLTGQSDGKKNVKVWATSDSDGKAEFKNIPIGDYTLTEVSALGKTDSLIVAGPESYWDVQPRSQGVTIEYAATSETATATVKNIYKSGKLIVKKELDWAVNPDIDVNPSKKDFTFELVGRSFGNGSEYTDINRVTARTDENGIAVFENIPIGDQLVLREVGTNKDDDHKIDAWWQIPPENNQITITYDEMPVVSMTNIYKTGNLKIQKHIDDSAALMDDRLAGFKFRLTGTSDGGTAVDVVRETDHDGVCLFENVPIGTYDVEEIASPGRDDLDPRWNSDGLKQTAIIKAEHTAENPLVKEFTNTYATGNLVVTKKVENKSAYGAHDGKDFMFRLTRLTDNDELDERFVYEATTGTSTGQLVGTIRIKDNQAVFENIPVGRYKLTEVNTPEPKGDGSWWTVTTDPEDGIVTIEHDADTNDQITKHATVTNVYQVGNVAVYKDITDPSNTYKTRAGFVFRLTGKSASGEDVDMTAETDNNGYALFENVPVGSAYSINEIKIFNDDTDISNTGPDFYWDIQNSVKGNSVEVVENATTGVDGDLRINNIYKTGDLVVQKDISNPALHHETPYGVSGKNNFTFRLHGKSYKNQNLDYEDIDLYATTGDDWITYGTNWEATTHDGVEGEAHFAGIPIGTYTLEEVNVPDYTNGIPTWWEPTLAQTVNITYGGLKVVPWMNRYKTGDIEVQKVVEDPSGLAESLEGFVFKLEGTSESGVDVVEVESTNKYGIAQFVDIPIGKNYKIYEIGTPENASNIPEWWDNTEASEGRGRSVEIVDKQATDSGEAEIPVESFTNVYKTGSVKVTKLIRESSFNDGISKESFAFRMTGTSLSGKEIEKYAITDENGDAFFENVPIGDNYTIAEVSKKDVQDAANAGNREAQKIAHLKIHTLEGYITQEPLQGVEVEYNTERHLPKETTVTFSNEQTKTMINIMDYDTDVELDDVYLRIKNTKTDDTVVYSLKTIHDNNNIVYGLAPGETYTITEIRPRPGYAFNLYEKEGYRSKYADTGFKFDSEIYDGIDLDPTVSTIDPNEATFTVQDVSGVQIVSLFNKPVKSELTVEKKGEVISTQIRNEELTKYRYEIKGLPNAEYTVRAAEDIKRLDGYTYDPYIPEGRIVARLTTDENGVATTEPLYLGKYEIEETKAPRGYYLDESKSKQIVDLFEEYMQSHYYPGQTKKEKYAEEVVGAKTSFTNERQIVDIGNDPDPGDIPFDDPRDPTQENYTHAGVYKIGVDGSQETYVEGAEFTLYAAEDIVDPFGKVSIPKDTKLETAVSDAEGRARFHTDLPVGKYYVKETNAPDGYYSSKAKVVFDTSEWENNDEVEFIRMTGEIRNAVTSTTVFLKDDKTLNELADASLKVTDPDGNVVDAWITTNTEGNGYVIKGLDPGVEYTLTEVIPRDGYTNNVIIPEDMKDKLTPAGHNSVKFTIPDEELADDLTDTPESYEITILNRFITGSVIVSKEGEVLESAQNLWSKHQFVGQIIDWVKTVFSFGGRGSKDVEFTIYAAENIYHPDGVTGLLYKKDQPVKIKVRSSNDDAVLVTDETGKVLFDEMFLGKFYVMETNHPEGYITNTSKVPFSLVVKDFVTDEVWADTNVDFVNTRQKVSIKVNKADEKDHTKVLSGAVFGLYTREDIKNADGMILLSKNSLVETQETDANGVAVFEADLPLGKYVIREEAAPDGYVLNDSEIFVDATWKENGPEYQKFSYNVYNEKSKVYIDKLISGTDKRLPNVDLGIYLGNKEIERWTTTGKSHLIEGLTIGQTYTLKELKAPAGYATAKDVTFTVEEPTDEIQQVVMKDEPIRIEIQTWSVNKNGKEKELEGVKMHLETKDGAVVTIDDEDLRWTSETSPTNWDKVPVGEYVIVVDSVPEGCVKPDPTPITVKDTPEIQHFDVKVPTINVDVVAVDSNTNEPLNGVVVTIYDEDKKPVYEHVDLEFIKDKVPAGNYTVEVEDVPEGYVTPPPFDMVVEEKSETQNFVIPIEPTTVVINAVDSENNNPVEDVIVTVYDKDGNPVREHVPLEYATTKLEPGDYTIHVDSVPDGYVKPTEDTPITVKDTSEKQIFTIPIDPIDIYIKAIDKVTGEEMIKNVYVTVYDKDGHKLFNNVPLDYAQEHVKPGEYTIHVNEVPEGYIIPEDMHITVKQQKGTQTFIVPVEYIKTAYEVLDDKTGKPVDGVKMHLVGADGKTYATWTSEKGWTYKDKIPAGDYKIVVDSVPKGYAIPAPKAITIKSIADLQKFIIKLKAAVPKDKVKAKTKKSDKKKSSNNKGKNGNGSGSSFTRNGSGSNGLTRSAKTWDILFLMMLGASVVLGIQFFDRKEKKKKKTDENDG